MDSLKEAGLIVTVNNGRRVISRDIDGEMVLLDLHSGMYYGLNQVGAFVWSLISAKRGSIPVEEVVAAVVDEFEVDDPTARRDLHQLLMGLSSNWLVNVRG